MLRRPQPRQLARLERRSAEEKALRHAYALVDEADGGRCVLSGVRTVTQTADPWRLRTHHHLVARSLAKTRRFEPANIITLSLAVHQLVTARVLWLLTEAGEPATDRSNLHHLVWDRERVPVGREPFRSQLPVVEED